MNNNASHNLFSKKLIAGLFFVLMLTPLSSSLTVQRAEAIPVVIAADPWTVFQTIGDGVRAGYSYISSFLAQANSQKEFTLDGIAWAVSKAAVSTIVQSTTDWVRSGFKGSPAFVTDLDGFLQQTADRVASDFIQGSKLSALCEPFALNIKGALDLNYFNGRNGGDRVARCTIDTLQYNLGTFGKSVDGVKSASWSTWMNIAANKNNNPYGAYLEAESKLGISITNRQGQEVNLLSFGSGFLSQKKCTSDENGKEHCSVTTPGQTISASLNKSLGLGSDSLVAADEINELVGALMGQIVKSVLSESGLAGYTPPSGGGYIGHSASEPAGDVAPIVKNINDLNTKQKEALAIFTNIAQNITDTCSSQIITDDTEIAKLYAEVTTKQAQLQQVISELTSLSRRAQESTGSKNGLKITNEYNNYSSDPRVYINPTSLKDYEEEANNLINNRCVGTFHAIIGN